MSRTTKTSVRARVNAGAALLTTLYGTRRVWGIGPKAIKANYSPEGAIFERLGIDSYMELTADVDAAGLTGVGRLNGGTTRGEVSGEALGFWGGGNVELQEAWVTKFREMRAESIGSTGRTGYRRVTPTTGSGKLAPVSTTHELFTSDCR